MTPLWPEHLDRRDGPPTHPASPAADAALTDLGFTPLGVASITVAPRTFRFAAWRSADTRTLAVTHRHHALDHVDFYSATSDGRIERTQWSGGPIHPADIFHPHDAPQSPPGWLDRLLDPPCRPRSQPSADLHDRVVRSGPLADAWTLHPQPDDRSPLTLSDAAPLCLAFLRLTDDALRTRLYAATLTAVAAFTIAAALFGLQPELVAALIGIFAGVVLIHLGPARKTVVPSLATASLVPFLALPSSATWVLTLFVSLPLTTASVRLATALADAWTVRRPQPKIPLNHRRNAQAA